MQRGKKTHMKFQVNLYNQMQFEKPKHIPKRTKGITKECLFFTPNYATATFI